jgi:hypothetical protein
MKSREALRDKASLDWITSNKMLREINDRGSAPHVSSEKPAPRAGFSHSWAVNVAVL